MRPGFRLVFIEGASWFTRNFASSQSKDLVARARRRSQRPARTVMSQQQQPTLLSARLAAEIDRRLMDDIGYSLDQLMELAGHAVAVAVVNYIDRLRKSNSDIRPDSCHIAVVCGPGNNGGDGLVCARHLSLMGCKVSVVCPVNRFPQLTKQLEAFRVPFVGVIPIDAAIVIDSIFGFSFTGPPVREPFQRLIQEMKDRASSAKLICVDVPSGWHVDEGNIYPENAVGVPNALVSLTAPKLCTKALPSSCIHYVGGRFVPPSLCSDLKLELPPFPGAAPITLLDDV